MPQSKQNASASARKFPLQGSAHGKPIEIPWDYVEEAYKQYSHCYGTQQSLERLAERGGFGVHEIIDLLVQRITKLETRP